MRENRLMFSAVILTGTLAFSGGYVWSQQPPQGSSPDPSAPETSKSREPGQSKSQKDQSGDIKGSGSQAGSPEIQEPSQRRGQKSLGGSEKAQGQPSESRTGRAGTGSEDIKKIQEALKEKGHDPGPIDGVAGPKTREALKAFQSASGIEATGRVDAQTAKALGTGKGGSSSTGKEPSPGAKDQPSPMGKDAMPRTQEPPPSK